MHRIDGPGATVTSQFTQGNPITGVPATVVTDAWLNSVQEEIAHVVEGAGNTLSKPDNTQLLTAIQQIVAVSQGFTTGDVKLTLKTVTTAGWIIADDGTIGSALSTATTRANADTENLYKLLWANVSNTWAPVTGGRGASAAADFAANKPLKLTRLLGRALAISGGGASLTTRQLGEFLGAETHVLTTGEMPAHNHAVVDPGHAHTASFRLGQSAGGFQFPYSGQADNATFSGVTVGSSLTGISTVSNGSGTAHNNMQPTIFLNAMIKL